jgi:hypothetical protein
MKCVVHSSGGLSYAARNRTGELTANHPSSSYGLPVVLLDGQPHGPGDVESLTPVTETEGVVTDGERSMIEAAQRAGFRVIL